MGVSEITDCAIFRKKIVYRKKPYTGNILTLRGKKYARLFIENKFPSEVYVQKNLGWLLINKLRTELLITQFNVLLLK